MRAWYSLLLVPFVGAASAAKAPVVELKYASYRGNIVDGVAQWFGMRYAAPPVGDLRFEAPQDPDTENGIVDAMKVSSVSHPSQMEL